MCNISYLHCLCSTVCSVHTVFGPVPTCLVFDILDRGHCSMTTSWCCLGRRTRMQRASRTVDLCSPRMDHALGLVSGTSLCSLGAPFARMQSQVPGFWTCHTLFPWVGLGRNLQYFPISLTCLCAQSCSVFSRDAFFKRQERLSAAKDSSTGRVSASLAVTR